MLEISKNTHLLEKDPYKYRLQEVPEPELFREIYPYTEVPRVVFNHRRVDLAMPEEIWITDTSFRDGQQSQAPYKVEHMVELYKLMHRLGGEKGIIRQTEFFIYSENDRKAIEKCMELGFKFPEITTWIRASKKDFELVRNIGIKETGILVSCSDYHIFKKLKMSRSQAMDHYLSVVADAFDAGVVPAVILRTLQGGLLRLCCTLRKRPHGYVRGRHTRKNQGLRYFRLRHPIGSRPPRSVPGIINGLRHYAGVPSAQLEWHGHNDFYKAVVNAGTAWLYGASAVNCSLLGIGERTGNVPLEAMVMEYISLRGTTDGMDTTAITEIARYFEEEMGYQIPPMTPFVGRDFNQTRAGIHADGLMKDEEIYNIFDTKAILNRGAGVAVNNASGLAGIAYWINDRYNLSGTGQ